MFNASLTWCKEATIRLDRCARWLMAPSSDWKGKLKFSFTVFSQLSCSLKDSVYPYSKESDSLTCRAKKSLSLSWQDIHIIFQQKENCDDVITFNEEKWTAVWRIWGRLSSLWSTTSKCFSPSSVCYKHKGTGMKHTLFDIFISLIIFYYILNDDWLKESIIFNACVLQKNRNMFFYLSSHDAQCGNFWCKAIYISATCCRLLCMLVEIWL